MAGGTTPTGPGSKSTPRILANIFISFTGAGVLGIPYAFKESGVVEGGLIMAFVGVISVKAMLMLISCKYVVMESPSFSRYCDVKKHAPVNIINDDDETLKMIPPPLSEISIEHPHDLPREASYGDIGFYALGHSGRLLVECVIVVSQLGFSCAYLIFISSNLSDYIHGLKLIHWLCILLPPLYLLTLCRHLSSLAVSSMLAQCSSLMAFAVVFWFDFEHFYSIDLKPQAFRMKGFPFFLCIAIYSFEGAGMILSLEMSVAKTARHKFKKLFVVAMSICTTLYISFGVCGYMSFGVETMEIITLNLPMGEGSLDVVMMVKSCLSMTLMFTYPVMIFPVVQILERYFITDPVTSIWRGNLLRLVLVLTTGCVVLIIPNFANLMALVGATCCTLLAFILPGLFHMIVNKKTISRAHRMFDIFLIGFGIVGAIIGTLDALKRLVMYHIEHAAMSQVTEFVNVTSSLPADTTSPLFLSP